ncbi:MAG TPA: GNAT family N-acetyltransferase [Longimicrobium sp.]|nr:GNAT family N-acetyltransferase [Longimicrobium sp.]
MTARERFTVPLEVEIRPCTADDLPNLEWHGMFALDRPLIHEAFERQRSGQGLMLLAVANAFPIGQAWIDFDARPDERGVAVIWSVRVYPFLRGGGIGARLLAAAEAAIRERGFRIAEIGVEKDNPRARTLYERVGYRLHREMVDELRYNDWDGKPVVQPVDQWMLRKDVRRASSDAWRGHASTARGT